MGQKTIRIRCAALVGGSLWSMMMDLLSGLVFLVQPDTPGFWQEDIRNLWSVLLCRAKRRQKDGNLRIERADQCRLTAR